MATEAWAKCARLRVYRLMTETYAHGTRSYFTMNHFNKVLITVNIRKTMNRKVKQQKKNKRKRERGLECAPMPNVIAALLNIGGDLR